MKEVALLSDQFEKALDRYIDYHKPDPICRKQLEGWSLEWKTQQIQPKTDEDASDTDSSSPGASHQLSGTLEIAGEYMVILLEVVSRWRHTGAVAGGGSKAKQHYGEFLFSCHASARFLTKSELKKRKKQDKDAGKSKAEDKIRGKMVSRLREDDYISKLLSTSSDADEAEAPPSEKQMLAQAKIQFSPDDLEERVTTSENVCEGIKRAIWSSAESPLDIVEVLLQFPFLPVTDLESSEDTTSSLANRAKLRLLEDAMCDACEKEGEDELLDDLRISEKKQKR